MSSFRVKSQFGSYPGVGSNNLPAFLDDGQTQRFWISAITPWVGAEYFFWNHGSLNVAADFLPETTEHLADAPASLAFGRRRVSVTAAIRLFF